MSELLRIGPGGILGPPGVCAIWLMGRVGLFLGSFLKKVEAQSLTPLFKRILTFSSHHAYSQSCLIRLPKSPPIKSTASTTHAISSAGMSGEPA